MNKSAIQRFAIWARTELIAQVSQRAYQYGITEEGYGEADAVTVRGRALNPDEAKQRRELVGQISRKNYKQVMEEIAYTWFNRFIALRFMEVNNYLPRHVRLFSDSAGAFKPEILANALYLNMTGLDEDKVAAYIEGNKTEDLYRYLLITQCNALNEAMPQMFEKIGGYTELLFPNNILRAGSVIGRMVSDIPEEDWTDQVQIIGWLYQYYNTELNKLVYDGNMSKDRIPKELLPAATTIYTPDWVVRYMVENSLGRLWIEGHPDDDLKAGWKYYLNEAVQEAAVQAQLDAIRVEYAALRPQDIKVIDPCVGSGHILVYAFDVLMQIYKSQGYSERDAAQSILLNNLYGLDIDDRAAHLAYFAVMMKARQYDRHIFLRGIQPHVHPIAESNELDENTIYDFTKQNAKLKKDLGLLVKELRDAKEYGSILNVTPVDCAALYARVEEIRKNNGIFKDIVLTTILPMIQTAELLTLKYDVVITNPPYLGSSRFSERLDNYVKQNYSDVKSDLSMVMYKAAISNFTKTNGFIAFITTSSWMFLSSFERLRNFMNDTLSIYSLVDFGTELFDGKVGHNAIVSWVTRNVHIDYKMIAIKLVEYCYSRRGEKEAEFFNIKNRYIALQSNFSKIPGFRMVYWVSKNFISNFVRGKLIGNQFPVKKGMDTSDNDRFLRFWHEVQRSRFSLGKVSSGVKWYPYDKGGNFRRWYGNKEYIINFEDNGHELERTSANLRSRHLYFKNHITWSAVTTSSTSFRYCDYMSLFDSAGSSMFPSNQQMMYVLALMNTKVCDFIMEGINRTINYGAGSIALMPLLYVPSEYIEETTSRNVEIARADWDSFETSWDFLVHPLVLASYAPDLNGGHKSTVAEAFDKWKKVCNDRFTQLKANEEELNHIFINIYDLQDELTSEVRDEDVTVRKADLRRDIRSLVSYAVGCMFGRYSLDEPGLAYAGGSWDDSKYSTFSPSSDNIIPICDEDYLDGDITARFVKWVETVYGSEKLEENLKFIADAIGGTGMPREVIRKYFLKDFFDDHCKIYQKRPIYWLFDSGKKNGFKALIYMHRYRSDLLARMRTEYIHEMQERYRTQLAMITDALNRATGAERAKLTKRQKKIQEQAQELQKYEEKIHHLADKNISINLDYGVKHNYALFSDVLAKIK